MEISQNTDNSIMKENCQSICVYYERREDNYNFKSVILIKIDVEGHELETLKGSKNTLIKNNRPLIIFEAWKRESL